MTPSNPSPLQHTWKIIRLLAFVILVALIATLAWRYGWRDMIDAAVTYVRAAGAPAFFCAMAILPLGGFPLMPFALTAGPAFAPTLGMPLVIFLMIGAVVINVSLSYWLGLRLVAPMIPWLCRKFGWQPPQLQSPSAFILTVIIRSAPGIPFWVQSYVLAGMRVPFGIYLIVSTLIPTAYLSCMVVFGNALIEGQPRAALGALGVMLLLGTILHFVRKHIVKSSSSVSPSDSA